MVHGDGTQAAAIVVLTYRAPAGVLERAVDAVLAAGGPRPIVVDNGVEAAARLQGRDVDLVLAPSNGGYGAGMNLGLRRAFASGADRVALLNDDVIVEDGWLATALAAFDSSSVGAVQPLLVDVDGVHVNSAGVSVDAAGQGSDVGRGEHVADIGHDPIDIDAFTGGAVVVTQAFVDDVGGFDERFFLYYEDVELSRRGRRRGWVYRLVPASRVRHLGSATTASLGDRARYLQERNRVWCACMTGDPSEVLRAAWLSLRRLRHEPRATHAAAAGAGVAGGAVRLAQRASGRCRTIGPSQWRGRKRPADRRAGRGRAIVPHP